jgi:hypothetical protein
MSRFDFGRFLALASFLGVLAACSDGKIGENPNADMAGANSSADMAGGNSSADMAGANSSADMAEANSTADLAPSMTVTPPSVIWPSSGGGSFTATSGTQASFSIGGQSVYGSVAAGGATITFGSFSTDTY